MLRRFTARLVLSKNSRRSHRSARPNITRGWHCDRFEASEKIGKAPYFNYQNAREDIEKVLSEFKIYLKGDESTDLPPAVPLIVDGRYFAESIKNFLATRKTDDGQAASNLQGKSSEARSLARKPQAKTLKRHERKVLRTKSKEPDAKLGNDCSSTGAHTSKQQDEARQDRGDSEKRPLASC